MAKHIAILSYSLDKTDPLTADALVFQDIVMASGYTTTLLSQQVLNETSSSYMTVADWEKYQGVVICNFYYYWNLRELIQSRLPVLCANIGYVDDLGLAEMPQEHISADMFNVVAAHPITAGLPLGGLNIGAPVWLDSTSTLDHLSDTLVTTAAKNPVLVAHKTHKLTYFGWYLMSDASVGSPLFSLLAHTAKWTFS